MSNGRLLPAQQWDPVDNIDLPFTQQMMDFNNANALIGDSATELIPHDRDSYQVRVWNESAIQAEFDAVAISFPGYRRLILPRVLTSISLDYNTQAATGTNSQTSSGVSTGLYAALSITQRAQCQAGGAIMPELAFTIQEYDGHITPTQNCIFYFPYMMTQADVIAKVQTILSRSDVFFMPNFAPESITFALMGAHADVTAMADITQQVSISQSNVTRVIGQGTGYSGSAGVQNKFVTLPSCLHAAISLTGSDTATVATTASITGSSGTNWTAQTETSTAPTITLNSQINPSSVSATTPADIPHTGFYIVDVTAEPYKWNRLRVRVEGVDMSFFPAP